MRQARAGPARSLIELRRRVDTRYISVMDCFEIFMDRMALCRKAADRLGPASRLYINGQALI